MRIGLDCRLSGPAHAGIGRYIENLLVRLPTLAPDIEWSYIFLDQKQFADILHRADSKWQAQLKKVDTTFVPVRHYSLREQQVLPKIISQLKLDLLHVPHFNIPILYRGKLIVTIHDLLWHEYRGTHVTTLKPWKYWLKYLAYRWVVNQAVRRAKKILVPAETIKKTISTYFPHCATKIVVTKEGVDDRLSHFKQLKSARRKNTLLYVGSLYPHKNIRLVIKSLHQLTDWQLIIVGARSAFQDEIKQFVADQKLGERVIFTGFLTDEQLAAQIRTATALVQPSLSEGFGLTGVEAMSLSTPVLASDIPIFHEIYQDAAIFFDPHSETSFADQARSLADLQHQKWQAKADHVIAQYDWDQMVQQTIDAYLSIA